MSRILLEGGGGLFRGGAYKKLISETTLANHDKKQNCKEMKNKGQLTASEKKKNENYANISVETSA